MADEFYTINDQIAYRLVDVFINSNNKHHRLVPDDAISQYLTVFSITHQTLYCHIIHLSLDTLITESLSTLPLNTPYSLKTYTDEAFEILDLMPQIVQDLDFR